VVKKLYEPEEIAANSATVAPKNLLAGMHVKRWCFVCMEGAAANELMAGTPQSRVLTGNRDEIGGLAEHLKQFL
jgi:hypothetical protein